MHSKVKSLALCLLPITFLAGAPTASAQEGAGVIGEPTYGAEPATGEATTTEPATESVPPPPPTQLVQPTMAAAPVTDGPRFRGAVAFTIGGEGVPNADYTAIMAGIDGRFGIQLNDLIGIYVEPHLSFGGKRGAGAAGSTGTFATLAMVDFTFADAFVVGAGFGYIVFNNPNGPAVGFRAGWYPVKSVSETTVRRRGLVVSVESRIGFLGDIYGTAYQVMGAIGYETF